MTSLQSEIARFLREKQNPAEPKKEQGDASGEVERRADSFLERLRIKLTEDARARATR